MIEENFSRGDSIIHKLDPRIKIIYAIIFSVMIAVATKFEVVSLGFAISVILVILARLKLMDLLTRLLVVNGFIFLLWLILPFSFSGRLIFSLGRFSISFEGVIYTLLLTIKCNTIVLAGIALISTLGIFELAHALKHMRIMDKFIYLFFLIYRYANVVLSGFKHLKTALKVRGFSPRTSILTYQTYGFVIGTLLVRSHDQAEEIHKAMLCRGFNGKFWVIDHFEIEKKDIQTAIFLSLTVAGLGLLEWSTIIH